LRIALPVLLSIAFLATACSAGRNQPPPWMRPTEKPRDENYRGGPSAMLLKFDANKDGIVARDELIAGLRAEFAAHDVKRNGCLDGGQVAEINQERVDADQSTATPLIDWNQDGCINYTEFSAAPYSLFDQLDRNRDARLTPLERGQRPAGKPAEGAGEPASDTPPPPAQ
jgi:Ca2+-binding EF-hand superfamily protein